jgi:hypothetical protein
MSQISALTPFPGNYAYAVICVSTNDITNLFNIKDPSSSNPVFYIDASGFSQLIVSTNQIYNSVSNYGTLNYSDGKQIRNALGYAYVYNVSGEGINNYDKDTSNLPYTVDNKTIINDVIRNLANHLFNTQYAAKIIRNNATIITNIHNTILSLFSQDNSSNIYGVLNTANGMCANDVSLNTNGENIGLQMYNAIMETYPERMNLNSLVVTDISNNIYKMPLYSGDNIYMILRMNYAVGQGSIVGISDPTSRNYQVCLRMV